MDYGRFPWRIGRLLLRLFLYVAFQDYLEIKYYEEIVLPIEASIYKMNKFREVISQALHKKEFLKKELVSCGKT